MNPARAQKKGVPEALQSAAGGPFEVVEHEGKS